MRNENTKSSSEAGISSYLFPGLEDYLWTNL